MVKIGIIGAGFAGNHHAQAYKSCPDASITTVVDIDHGKAIQLAIEVNCDWGVEVEKILADPEIDLVDVCLPTPFHTEYALRAFSAGKHVMVEKPLALSLPDADAILSAARQAEKFLMVGHVLRFWPEYIAIHEKLCSGELGKPLFASASRLSNLPQWADWFRDPRKTGGAVLDLMIHDLDMMNWLFGEPKTVFASGIQDSHGGWNHVTALVNYEAVQTSVEASFMMPKDYPFTAGLRILCEGGVVEYQFRAGGASFESGQPIQYAQVHTPGHPFQELTVAAGDAFQNEMNYFVNCVKNDNTPSMVIPQDARLAVATSLAVKESLEKGQIVVVG